MKQSPQERAMRAAWRLRYIPDPTQKREHAHQLCQYLRSVLSLGYQKTKVN